MHDTNTCPNCGCVFSNDPQPKTASDIRHNTSQYPPDPKLVGLADKVEERRHKRLQGDFKASIRIGDKEDIVSVTDLSRRGVRFSSTVLYKLGTMVKVAAPYVIDGDNIFLTGRIIREHRRSTKLVPGEYAVEILPGV